MKKVDDPDEKRVSLGEFATSTSAHGFARVAQSRHLVMKALWIILIVAGFVVATIQIEMRFSAFIRRDTVTKTSMVFNTSLSFPAVTICNYNRYVGRRLNTMDRLYLNGATLYLAALSSKNSRAYAHINLDNIKNLNMTAWYGSGYTFANFTKDKGWLLNERNARCTFRGEDCNITADFKHVFTEFGNCYTFNSGDDPSRNLFQDQAGIGNGLRIEINIQQEQYTNLILRGDAPDAGILFHVHNQSEPASVETDGRAVGPGLHAYAGLTRSDFATLHPPYGQCNETASLEFYPVYTMSGCVVECKRKHILRHCNCRLMEHPGYEPVCGLIRILTCVKPLLVNLTQDFTGMCSCSVPCSSVVYQTALSYSLVPSESTKVEASNTLGVAVDDARKNHIILDVYFQSLNYQQSEQLPAVEWTALISDIGGQFGLFMGFSLLTVVEFIEFAIMSVVTLTAAKRSQNKVKGHDTIHRKGDKVTKSSKTGRISMQGDFVQVHEIF